MSEKRSLGRGLGSLLAGSGRFDGEGRTLLECPLEDIIPNENQPRKLFDKTTIEELAASIEEKGFLQPIVVRKIGGGKFEIIAGERRYRAAKHLHLNTIPALVKEVDASETLELALIENLQRENLNPIEEALAFKELLSRYQYTQDELAKRIGKDRSSIANTLRLLKLPEEVRQMIIDGKISMGHAKALLGVENRDLQKQLAQKIIENTASVREIEDVVRRLRDAEVEDTAKKETGEEKPPVVQLYGGVEEELKKSLKAKVQIKSTGRRGKIIIHFKTPDELDQLVQQMTRGIP